MGQYWKVVNLDKREYLEPHKLGAGLKLWEQLANHPGTPTAILILCAAMPEHRGGGDLGEDPVIGRWAGDRIVWVGDYAEDEDLVRKEGDPPASVIYGLCRSREEFNELLDYWMKHDPETFERATRENWQPFTDITDQVCPVIERERGGKYEGDGWRNFTRNGESVREQTA